MSLTTTQNATLKAVILADPILNAYPNNSDGAFDIAVILNGISVPPFTVWKTLVPLSDVFSAINGGELEALTTAESSRMQVIALFSVEGVNPSRADTRALFDGIFGGAGGTFTRPALLVLWKRIATEGEQIFATGTGTDLAPATLTFEGELTPSDVHMARNS